MDRCEKCGGVKPGPNGTGDCQCTREDAVNHPSHYNSGNIEVLEGIEDWGLDFHAGNTVKYVARAGKKDPTKEIEDLEKAAWYLARKIELLTAKREGRPPCRPNEMGTR